MRPYLPIIGLFILFFACQPDSKTDNARQTTVEEGNAPERPAPRVINEDLQVADPEKLDNLKPKSPTEREPIRVTKVRMEDVPSTVMANKGKEVFNSFCKDCHRMEGNGQGVALDNLLSKREPAWVMNFLYFPGFEVNPTAEGKCVVRQPGRLLNVIQARDFLEYTRLVEIRNNR